MFASSLSCLSLLLASALAAPQCKSCDISKAVLKPPTNQTAIVPPASPPSFIALAFGVQNYTCSNTSIYTSVGAVAELYDISCLYNTKGFSSLQDSAYKTWKAAPSHASATTAATTFFHQIDSPPSALGQHYFITNPVSGVGISPKWDFTSTGLYAGNPNAFVTAAKVASIPAPSGSGDVDWLSLAAVQGELASQVFRVDTKGGQPPASCTPGSPLLSVKYTSKYWLYGGTVKK